MKSVKWKERKGKCYRPAGRGRSFSKCKIDTATLCVQADVSIISAVIDNIYLKCYDIVLTLKQTRFWQDCFILPGPPNFFMSLHVLHSPQSSRWQFSHWPHLVRRLRTPGPTLVPNLDIMGTALWRGVFSFYNYNQLSLLTGRVTWYILSNQWFFMIQWTSHFRLFLRCIKTGFVLRCWEARSPTSTENRVLEFVGLKGGFRLDSPWVGGRFETSAEYRWQLITNARRPLVVIAIPISTINNKCGFFYFFTKMILIFMKSERPSHVNTVSRSNIN